MKNQQTRALHYRFFVVAIVLFSVSSSFADLLSFPLSASQRGTVTCLENPSYTYDIYLPPLYSTNGTPLPILYTMAAGGGGLVTSFQSTCSNLNIILIGITGTRNGVPWNKAIREMYAVTRDVRQRVLYDPTAEFAGGFSGGGVCSYMFSRLRAQHVAGVLEMAGWLARINDGSTVTYYGKDRVQTNLLVARTTGTTDTGAQFYNVFDSNYLATCGAVVHDWAFTGGHAIAPNSLKSTCLTWLVNNRTLSGPNDRSNALAQAAGWQTRIDAGDRAFVLSECVSNLMNHPRSWFAYQAQLTLDDMMANYTTFRTLNLSNLAQGDFASDLFYYYALGAATNADWSRYNSCMKALTGITVTNDFDGTTTIGGITVDVIFPTTEAAIYIVTTNRDRSGDIYTLLTNFNQYASPEIQYSTTPTNTQMNLSFNKDTPGLAYSVESRGDFDNDIWTEIPASSVENDTRWTAVVDVSKVSSARYFHIRAVPVPATSAPWIPP